MVDRLVAEDSGPLHCQRGEASLSRMICKLALFGLLAAIGCGPQGSSGSSDPGDAPSTDAASEQSTRDACVQAHQDILSDLNALSLQYATSCTQASDCVLVDLSIPCQAACKLPVREGQRAAFSAALSDYAASTCPTAPSTCGVSGSCAISGAACVEGVCRPVL